MTIHRSRDEVNSTKVEVAFKVLVGSYIYPDPCVVTSIFGLPTPQNMCVFFPTTVEVQVGSLHT